MKVVNARDPHIPKGALIEIMKLALNHVSSVDRNEMVLFDELGKICQKYTLTVDQALVVAYKTGFIIANPELAFTLAEQARVLKEGV